MKRFHVHLGVPDLAASIRFYSDLFGLPPSVAKADYAKWMLDDPRVNFAISQRGARIGVNHLGLQAENADELAELRTHFNAADASTVVDEANVSCCYARSDKHWVTDPQGIAWEAFHSLDSVPFFDGDGQPAAALATCGTATTGAATSAGGGCCAPSTTKATVASGCCAAD
jgi:catechol 2,3-dioxygenase-like lactoylglutathione lyase family enzyme